jgi:hypothetical protein
MYGMNGSTALRHARTVSAVMLVGWLIACASLNQKEKGAAIGAA